MSSLLCYYTNETKKERREPPMKELTKKQMKELRPKQQELLSALSAAKLSAKMLDTLIQKAIEIKTNSPK